MDKSKMNSIKLKNKPLIEAIFDLRWEIPMPDKDILSDPYYKILVGQLYGLLRENYQFIEELPTSTIPDEISPYVIKVRFRKERDQWPLVQLGPGILTFNDIQYNSWEDFKKEVEFVINCFFSINNKNNKNLVFNSSILRYINRIPFNLVGENILEFLQKNFKIQVKFDNSFFKITNLKNLPSGLDLKFSFISEIPKGVFNIRMAKGKVNNEDSLIWELQLQSTGKNVPQNENEMSLWMDKTHEVIDKWFFNMLSDKLIKEFK